MTCIYRIESENQKSEVGFPFKFLPTTNCVDCQILQAQNAKDATCYNPELTEKTCTISPQLKNTPAEQLTNL
ncbi:MAG: hypothetical protein ACD_19C00176G0038 [uncultured bacterium]|nr:MAG: hypothetical protein ACD_19C00176G0038 [uncultured bacterium]